MSPRILILSASVGAGHVRAAQAIQAAFEELYPEADVRHQDALRLTNASFRRVYADGYFRLVEAAPNLIAHLYDRLDRPAGGLGRPLERLCFEAQRLNFRRLAELLTSVRWDLVINTHFLAPQLLAHLRRQGLVRCPQAIVTTDFEIHRLWMHSPCEQYFTATEEGRANLVARGIPADIVLATGIPIDPVFARRKTSFETRSRHRLCTDRPVVLQMAGGFGVGRIDEIHRALLSIQQPLQVVTVAGRNEAARAQLEAIPCPPRHQRIVMGFTDQMDELMAAADAIVSKPGGLTSSEALARGVAMVIVDPIPGQETRNADYLLENGAAIKIHNLGGLPHKLGALLSDPSRLDDVRDSARRIARPRAAFDIANAAIDLVRPLRRPLRSRPCFTLAGV